MKVASSIRYGGMLVDASECDYTRYKHLGLTCPICHRGVYLCQGAHREAHERKTKAGELVQVKGSSVPAYFAHFPDVSQAEVEQCELRSKQISETERQRIANRSKQQRLRLMQKHIVSMLRSSPSKTDLSRIPNALISNWTEAYRLTKGVKRRHHLAAEIQIQSIFREIIKSFSGRNPSTFFKERCELILSSNLAQLHPLRADQTWEIQTAFSAVIDNQMHFLICAEVAEFLKAKRQEKLLLSFCGDAFAATWDTYTELKTGIKIEDTSPGDWTTEAAMLDVVQLLLTDPTSRENFVWFAATYMFDVIATVSWADEFERLQKEEEARKMPIAV